jgi:hypothetical protein
MKTLKLYIGIALAGLMGFASCTKDETLSYDVKHSTTDGQARFKGTTTVLNANTGSYDVAPWTVIKISTDPTTKVFSQYWMSDSAGTYNVKGLGVGTYYIAAEYTDQFTGAKFFDAGATVTVGNSIDDVVLDFKLK